MGLAALAYGVDDALLEAERIATMDSELLDLGIPRNART